MILVRTKTIHTVDVILFCSIVPSIILHEISHGWVALAFGDDTAKRAGRLTLNPIAHIDPIGTIVLPALMAISGLGMFGWAKPVPVSVGKLRHPRNESVVVALAGPATNLVLAGTAAVVFIVFGGVTAHGTFAGLWAQVAFYFGLVNIWLAAFNLIPLPPLDGSAVVERMLPMKWWPAYLRIRPYTLAILLVLLLFGRGVLTNLFGHLENWWITLLTP